MEQDRRRFLALATIVGAIPFASAWAQTYPMRLIRIVVPFPAGGPSDVLARLLAHNLSAAFGQAVIVENRPGGAGGSVGVKTVAGAASDGYTLLLLPVDAFVQAPLVFKDIDYDPIKSFAPVASLVTSPYVVVVNPALPVRSIQELAAYAKANPGKVAFASPGRGTQPHLIGELFRLAAGAEMIHVPFRGTAPAINDLLAGQVQMLVDNLVSSRPYVEAGKLRALAVTSAARSPYLPEVPTTIESGFGTLKADYLQGLYAPAGTAPGTVKKLNESVNHALDSTEIRAALERFGAEAEPLSVSDFAALMVARWRNSAQTIAAAGLTPE
jgi:tripartite-type tricarboxylate transporter receptor subunit TctC